MEAQSFGCCQRSLGAFRVVRSQVQLRNEEAQSVSSDRRLRPALPLPRGIDAPATAAGDEDVEKDEAESDGEFAFVLDRKKAAGRVHHEIGDGHFTREDKGSQAGEESERKEEAAEEFNPAGNEHERGQAALAAHRMIGRREVKEFLGAVLEQQQADDDAKDAEKDRLPALQE
jgi:hypothetical protein